MNTSISIKFICTMSINLLKFNYVELDTFGYKMLEFVLIMGKIFDFVNLIPELQFTSRS